MTQPTTQPTTRPTAPLRLQFAAISDVGRVRKDNQDSGYAGEPPEHVTLQLLAGRLVETAQHVDRGGTRDVSAGRPADAVGDHEQVGSDVPGVLVVLADATHVGDRGVVKPHRVYFLSSRIVLPMRTWVPRVIVVGWVIRTVPM